MKITGTSLPVIVLMLLLSVTSNIGMASESGNADTTAVESELNQKAIANDIPFKKDEGYSGTSIVRILFAFIIVVLIASVAIFVLRRYYYGNIPLPKGDAKHINLIETKRLSPKLVVFLLDVQGERLILAQSGDNLAFSPQTQSAPSEPAGESIK